MERVFSMDETDKYWCEAVEESSAGMNRSSSMLALQEWLRETTTIKSSAGMNRINSLQEWLQETTTIDLESSSNSEQLLFDQDQTTTTTIQNEEITRHPNLDSQAYLETSLKHLCGVVALQLQGANQPALHHLTHKDSVILQDKDGDISGVQVESTRSGSQSNVDDMDPTHERRKLSNRESARRSRARKKLHLSELHTRFSQAIVDNSSLHKHFTDINQKKENAVVENKVLKAQVETLLAKVKLCEETIKRVTEFQALSRISTMGMLPSFSAVPEQHFPSSSQAWLQHGNGVMDIPPQPTPAAPNNTVSMQSSEHLHNSSDTQHTWGF